MKEEGIPDRDSGNWHDSPSGPQRGRDDLLDDPPALEQVKAISRRRFLSGAIAGGVAGLAVAAGTGVAVYQVADAQGQQAMESAQAEIARLQGLVDLYERLEKVGLDSILQTGMAALAMPLGVVEQGARFLKQGLELIEKALLSLREAVPTAQEALAWLESQVSALAAGVEKLEAAIARAVEKAGDTPVSEALNNMLKRTLDLLPFNWGDKIREAFQKLVALIQNTDELVRGINTRLLEPVQQKWFSTQEGQGVEANFLGPLVVHVLDPLEAHLGNLAALTDAWQTRLEAPARRALEERGRVRMEISRYKQDHGFQ